MKDFMCHKNSSYEASGIWSGFGEVRDNSARGAGMYTGLHFSGAGLMLWVSRQTSDLQISVARRFEIP